MYTRTPTRIPATISVSRPIVRARPVATPRSSREFRNARIDRRRPSSWPIARAADTAGSELGLACTARAASDPARMHTAATTTKTITRSPNPKHRSGMGVGVVTRAPQAETGTNGRHRRAHDSAPDPSSTARQEPEHFAKRERVGSPTASASPIAALTRSDRDNETVGSSGPCVDTADHLARREMLPRGLVEQVRTGRWSIERTNVASARRGRKRTPLA